MDKNRRIDRSIAEDMRKLFGADTPGIDVQIMALLDRMKREQEEEVKAREAERRQKEATENQFKELYDNHILPFEPYRVLYMGNVDKKSRKQIMEITGKSSGTLRKNIHDAKRTLKRKGLWDKFANLFNF